jgi:hypothetical protein
MQTCRYWKRPDAGCTARPGFGFHAQDGFPSGPFEQGLVSTDPAADEITQVGDETFEKIDRDDDAARNQRGIDRPLLGDFSLAEAENVAQLLLTLNDAAKVPFFGDLPEDETEQQHDAK